MNDDLLAGNRSDTYAPLDWITGETGIETDVVTIPSGTGIVTEKTVLGEITTSGNFIPSASGASDGSQVPKLILVHGVDASANEVSAQVYVRGCFNPTLLIFGAGHTAASVKSGLRDHGILLKVPH